MSESDSGGRRVSPAFRSMLRRELDDWVSEGVVDTDQSAAISRRYGLDDVAGRSGGLLVRVLGADLSACAACGGRLRIIAAKGRPTENAFVERLIRTLKEEEVYLNEYRSFQEADRHIGYFLEEVYMNKRIHSSLAYRTPAEFEAQFHVRR